VPTSVNKLIIDPAYVGLAQNAQAAISGNNTINALIGGSDGFGGDIIPEKPQATGTVTAKTSAKYHTQSMETTEYAYPGSYTAANGFVTTDPYTLDMGRPVWLDEKRDVIDPSLMRFINASLPERQSLATTHPEYLASTNVSTINVAHKGDVYITFVSEGAAMLNTLAYYTYKTNNPPTQNSGGAAAGGIDKVTYIFPNASSYGYGGALKSGERVKLGTFEAGTTIAFVLMQNAWSLITHDVDVTTQKFYSQPQLNPEALAVQKQHSVVLYDELHKLHLIGFEDLNRESRFNNPRDNSATDNDFNDLVFYATSNVADCISHEGCPPIDNGGDSDGDGVDDGHDQYPTDPTRAYDSYYPSKTGYATVAFEDNWPAKGDYDLNDLVVNYRYTFVNNAQNQVVEMKGEFVPMASGASFRNGFGLQLPVPASTVQSVTGQKTMGGYINFAGNGVEAGQSKAVIVPFDNQDLVLRNPDNSLFVNTMMSKDKVTGTSVTVGLSFVAPVPQANLQPSAFNPFLIGNLKRGYEVHLPGYAPTDLADMKLFGTDDDGSSPSRYYVSKDKWPWALSFTSQFSYPVEVERIDKAFLHYMEWVNSNGTAYTDWYSNTGSGYRNDSGIYSK
jgi:LruC domain-containing protein